MQRAIVWFAPFVNCPLDAQRVNKHKQLSAAAAHRLIAYLWVVGPWAAALPPPKWIIDWCGLQNTLAAQRKFNDPDGALWVFEADWSAPSSSLLLIQPKSARARMRRGATFVQLVYQAGSAYMDILAKYEFINTSSRKRKIKNITCLYFLIATFYLAKNFPILKISL